MTDFVSSTTYIKRPPCMTDVQEKFLYTRELLSGRIFLGSYEERRYVSVLKEYRDVVLISFEETDLLKDLDKLRTKWSGVTDIKWVGVTGPGDFAFPETYCFWVKLTDLAFGQYWFQIKHVKLLDHEILLQLKCIRKSKAPLASITPAANNEEELEKISTVTSINSTNISVSVFDTQKTFSAVKDACVEAVLTIRPYVTWTNFVTFIRLGCAFLIVILTGCVSLVGHVGEYVLKLIREVTLLINAFTPIIIQLIDFLSKIIGGFYILMARVLLGNGRQPNHQPYRNEIVHINNAVRNRPSNVPVDWRERNRILRQELLYNK